MYLSLYSTTIIITNPACPSTSITPWRKTLSATIIPTTLLAMAISFAANIECNFRTAGRKSCDTQLIGSTASAHRCLMTGIPAMTYLGRETFEATSFSVETRVVNFRQIKRDYSTMNRYTLCNDILKKNPLEVTKKGRIVKEKCLCSLHRGQVLVIYFLYQ